MTATFWVWSIARVACARIAVVLAALALAACRGESPGKRVVVLGLDGLDYELTRSLLEQGRLPNLARLAASGGFSPLATSIPPQSPIAWSSFITGLDPGGHGIFDFIHRDPETIEPYLSTTSTEPPSRTITVGDWQFPLTGGRVELLRHGQPFWDVLEEGGIATTILRMPANFPPSGKATHELSGMGTPDLLGTYGTFSFYTSEPFASRAPAPPGGAVYEIVVVDNIARAALFGPTNPLRRSPQRLKADFTIYVDPVRDVAKSWPPTKNAC